MKILVVDDDPHILRLTSTVLESGGYDVIGLPQGKMPWKRPPGLIPTWLCSTWCFPT